MSGKQKSGTPGKHTSPAVADTLRFTRRSGVWYLLAYLSDGRIIASPMSLYPTLLHAKPAERSRWRKIGGGQGFNWPDLDLDLSVEGMLAGTPESTAAAARLRRGLGERGDWILRGGLRRESRRAS